MEILPICMSFVMILVGILCGWLYASGVLGKDDYSDDEYDQSHWVSRASFEAQSKRVQLIFGSCLFMIFFLAGASTLYFSLFITKANLLIESTAITVNPILGDEQLPARHPVIFASLCMSIGMIVFAPFLGRVYASDLFGAFPFPQRKYEESGSIEIDEEECNIRVKLIKKTRIYMGLFFFCMMFVPGVILFRLCMSIILMG